MLLNLIPKESESAPLLLKLIQSKSWTEATNRAITHPEEADLSTSSSSTAISSFTSISSGSTTSNVLSLALRTGAPLSTIRALIDANPDLLFKAKQSESSNSNAYYYNAPFRRAYGAHSTPGYGTILHDGIKYRAVSMEALLYVIDQVVALERERSWISRGELKPAKMNFRNAFRTSSSNDNEPDFESENDNKSKRSFVDSNGEKQKQEQNSVRTQGSYSQQRELCTHSTLFNQTDDLGRTPLHCIIDRACCHSSTNDSNSSTTNNNSTKGSTICCENVMMVIKAIVKAFPPAVAKVDSDGHSPLDMVLMTSSPIIDEMEVELKVLDLVRIMLRAYPYAASPSLNSIKAGSFVSSSFPSLSSKLGINNSSPPIKNRRLLVAANSKNTTMLANNFASVRRYRGVLLADCNRRSYLDRVINGKVGGENPLSYALTYGRSASTIRLLLECSDSISNSNTWHSGLLYNHDNNNELNCNSHVSNSKNATGNNHIHTNDESCMAIINNNFEVPLHIAISMRAPTDVVELVLKSGPDAAGVPDRCNLSPICWAWIRFVIDCTSDPNTTNQEVGDVDTISNPSSRHGAEGSFTLPPIKISKRRFIPPGYIQFHEKITKRVIFHVHHYLLQIQKENQNELIAGPRKQIQLQSKCKEKIGTGFDDFCFKLSTLLPSAANSIATNSTSSSVTQLLSYPSFASSNSQKCKPSSSINDKWLLLHAACLLNCPRSVLYTALLLTVTSSKISGNQLNQKDIYGNLPIHYAASRPGYAQLSLPVGATQMPQRVVEPSIVFDILPLFKEGARVTNGRGQLPLHLAIEEEKIEIGVIEEEGILFGFHNAGTLSRSTNSFDDTDSIDFYDYNGREESRFRSPLMYIMSAYTEALERRDGITKLFPFMQAAVGNHSNINTIYLLLKENPALVGIGDSS